MKNDETEFQSLAHTPLRNVDTELVARKFLVECQLDHGGECRGLGPTGKLYHMHTKMVTVPSSPFIRQPWVWLSGQLMASPKTWRPIGWVWSPKKSLIAQNNPQLDSICFLIPLEALPQKRPKVTRQAMRNHPNGLLVKWQGQAACVQRGLCFGGVPTPPRVWVPQLNLLSCGCRHVVVVYAKHEFGSNWFILMG